MFGSYYSKWSHAEKCAGAFAKLEWEEVVEGKPYYFLLQDSSIKHMTDNTKAHECHEEWSAIHEERRRKLNLAIRSLSEYSQILGAYDKWYDKKYNEDCGTDNPGNCA